MVASRACIQEAISFCILYSCGLPTKIVTVGDVY